MVSTVYGAKTYELSIARGYIYKTHELPTLDWNYDFFDVLGAACKACSLYRGCDDVMAVGLLRPTENGGRQLSKICFQELLKSSSASYPPKRRLLSC